MININRCFIGDVRVELLYLDQNECNYLLEYTNSILYVEDSTLEETERYVSFVFNLNNNVHQGIPSLHICSLIKL